MAVEAVIRRVPKGGTRSIKALARQLGYLSRQTDPDQDNVPLIGAHLGAAGPLDPNDIWTFARQLYLRGMDVQAAGTADEMNTELANDRTMHFVISFPHGTNVGDAELTGRLWAENVFGRGFRNDQDVVQRHDYVTAFHNHGTEHAHPHMHVVVDRVPRDGGHLLTLSRGHIHWSYEAMRRQAVDAAAVHGIELVATPPVPANMAQPQEEERRREAARRVPYHDPVFDQEGQAPGANEHGEDPTLDTVRQTCEPVFVPEPNAGNGPGDDQGGDGPNGGGGRGDGPSTRPGGGAPPRDQNQEPSNLDQDFDMGNDDRGEGPSGTRHETPPAVQSDQAQPFAGSSNSTNNQPLPLTAENLARLNQANAAAERTRQAQRLARRNQNEEENENDDNRRRKTPERNESPLSTLTPLSPIPSTLTPLPSTSDGGDSAGQEQAQVSPLDAARRTLDRAHAAERAFRRTRPTGGSEEDLRAWNAGHRQRTAEVRRALTAFNVARFGAPNVTTRSRARQEAGANPGPNRAAAARQAQAARRQANRVEREIENEEENRQRRTPANQEQRQPLSLEAARQALEQARTALDAWQARPDGGSEEERQNWQIERQRLREAYQEARTAESRVRFGLPNVTTRAQAQAQARAQAQAEQNRNARGRQRDQQNPGPSRSNHHRDN